MGASQRAFCMRLSRLPQFRMLTFVVPKSMFSTSFPHEPQRLLATLKSTFARGFHRFSSHQMPPATEFACCHNLTQPCQCDSQKPWNRTRLKGCACHATWTWTRPKCCASHEKLLSSSVNLSKVSLLSHRLNFGALQNVLQHHEVPRFPHNTTLQEVSSLQTWYLLQALARGTAVATSSQMVANNCELLQTQKQRGANMSPPPIPQRNPSLCILEKWNTWCQNRSGFCSKVFPLYWKSCGPRNNTNQQTRMQSRKLLLWNVKCEMGFSVKSKLETVECWGRNVVFKVWNVECGV